MSDSRIDNVVKITIVFSETNIDVSDVTTIEIDACYRLGDYIHVK